MHTARVRPLPATTGLTEQHVDQPAGVITADVDVPLRLLITVEQEDLRVRLPLVLLPVS